MQINKKINALLCSLLACLIWSGSFIIARGVHEFIQPISLSFWRWSVALAVIIPISYKQVKHDWPVIKTSWRYLIFMGLISVAIFNTMVYIAAHYTSAHHIGIISSTAPIWTILIASLCGIEKMSKYNIIGSIFAFCGAIIIITHGKFTNLMTQEWNIGDIILLASAIVWAIYSVTLHYKPKEIHPKSFMAAIILIGIIFLTPFYLWETSTNPANFSAAAWLVYLYLGIGSSLIAWFSWNYSINQIGSAKTSIIYYTIPIFSSILAITLLHEPIELHHLPGFVLIFLGIITTKLKEIKSFKPKNSS